MRFAAMIVTGTIVLAAPLFAPGSARAAEGDSLWCRVYGSPNDDGIAHITPARDGGYLLTGSSTDSAGGDAYLLKVDASGAEQWTRHLGGSLGWRASAAIATPDSGFYVAGHCDSGMLLAKVNAQGDTLWSRSWWLAGACGVALTPDGGAVLAGGDGVEIVRTDSSGAEQWVRTYGVPYNGYAVSLVATRDGGYLIAGYTYSAWWVLKVDADGDSLWGRHYGMLPHGREDDGGDPQYHPGYLRSAIATADGGFLLNGAWYWGTDWIPYQYRISLVKTDSLGVPVWSHSYGRGQGYDNMVWDEANGVVECPGGGYLAVGRTIGWTPSWNMYVFRLTTDGEFMWNHTYRGNADDEAGDALVALNGEYLVVGTTRSWSVYGQSDAWLGCIQGNPEPLGACCTNSASCSLTAASACQSPNVWHGEWDTCLPNPCPLPIGLGVCCTDMGSCSITYLPQCPAPNIWHSDWTICQPNPCPPPIGLGVCCTEAGSCVITIEQHCSVPNLWHGDWTACAPNPCPVLLGACCSEGGWCAMSTPSQCPNGWHGDWTTCVPNPCMVLGACCSDSTNACTLTMASDCRSGQWHGEWTSCLPNPCPPTAVGPNARGTMIVHDAGLLLSATNTSYSVCSQGVVPAHCWEADAQLEGTTPGNPAIFKVYAAFPEQSNPRLSGLTWGVNYADSVLILTSCGLCAEFEWNEDNWPAPGSGSSVAWNQPQTSKLVPIYWFAGYTYGAATTFSLVPHPEQGGFFTSDAVPPVLDRIAAYGSLGFGMPGMVECTQEGACCGPDGSCAMTLYSGCPLPGVWLYNESSCTPDPCVIDAVQPGGMASGRTGIVRVTPNPFQAATSIAYELAEAGSVRLEVFDASGRMVRTLFAGPIGGGRHVEVWNGLDAGGSSVSAGVYFVRLTERGKESARQIIRVR